MYLDSFNSDFPFLIDITKILLNTFNYKSVFNPNSSDFEGFYDSSETTLTKKLYISPYASLLYEYNKVNFIEYLSNESKRKGNNKLTFDDFFINLTNRKEFEIITPNGLKCYQFYLSKEDIEICGIKQELFNYEEAILNNYQRQSDFNSLLNRKLSSKKNRVSLIHDGRKSLFFNNLIIDFNSITKQEQSQFLLNYFNVHLNFISSFKYNYSLQSFKSFATPFLLKHYSRKVFLQLCKILFYYDHDLSAYIKFDNHQLISNLSKSITEFHPTGFLKTKSSFVGLLNRYLQINEIPSDIKNNYRLAKHIVETVTTIDRNFNVFYCLFPIELDKYELNPDRLYKLQNPESVKPITDIDLMFVIFNSSKFELYILEGKDQSSGFESAVRQDFTQRIIPNFRFPDAAPTIQIVNIDQAKGGYICFSN
ncbi:hypothetical protein [Telluribacter humicola]|uniref:hypothetical protein n=1 Tax=Telluribacter humicola TaxID=1720261 RepID=UPI001A975DE0|nr:hypothetical protein [Telluribacter humicola]